MAQSLRRRHGEVGHKSKWRVVGFVVGGILGAALVFCIVVLMLVLHSPPPPAIHTDPLSAKQFEEEYRGAVAAARAGTQQVVRATETQVNTELEAFMRAYRSRSQQGEGSVLTDAKIKLLGNQMQAYIFLDYKGQKLTLQLTGKLHAVNGYLQFEPESGKVGELPIPKSRLEAAGRQMMNAPGKNSQYRLPANISDIRVEDSKLIFVMK